MLVYKRLPLLIISIGGQPTVDSLVARQLVLGCVRKHEPVSKPVSSVLPWFLPQAPASSFSQWRVVFKVPLFSWDDFDQNVLSWRQKSKLEPTSNATTPCFIKRETETERQVCAHVLYGLHSHAPDYPAYGSPTSFMHAIADPDMNIWAWTRAHPQFVGY